MRQRERVRTFEIPDDFRAFMREVAARLYWEHDLSLLDHPCIRGERVDDFFEFVYIARDGGHRWVIRLDEIQLRGVAAGTVSKIAAREVVEREPLLVWGAGNDDALRVCNEDDLRIALDALYSTAPCVFRLWSTTKELVVATVEGSDCALHLVQSADGYGTSVGDPRRTGTFEVTDDAAGTLSISRAAAIPWWVARDALVQFASRGHLEGVLIEPRMSTRLLAYQSIDHAGELAARRLAAWDPALSSLPARTWHGRWAESVLARLAVLELVTLDRSIYDVIVARFAMLLVRSGERATMGPQDELVVQLAQIRGVTLTATPVQLQLALRRTYPVLPHLAVDEFELTTPPVS